MSRDSSEYPLVRRTGSLEPYQPYPTYEPQSDERDLGALGAMLKRQRRAILGVLGGTMLLAVAATLLWPETYTSTAAILVERGEAQEGQIPGLALLDRLERQTVLETEMELVQSRSVASGVVDQLDLHAVARKDGQGLRPAEVLTFFDAARDAIPGEYRVVFQEGGGYAVESRDADEPIARGREGSRVGYVGVQMDLPRRADEELVIEIRPFAKAVDDVLGRIKVRQAGREGDLLRISCEGTTPRSAQALCEGTTLGYVRLRGEFERSEASATAAFLREQVKVYKTRLAAAEDSLRSYGQRSQGVALGEQAAGEVREYITLRAERDRVEAERRALAQVLAEIERGPGDASRYRELVSFPAFLENPTVGEMTRSLVELETRRSELAQRRTELNPELAALDQRIEALHLQLRQMARSYERSLRSRSSSLSGVLGGASGRLSQLPERQVQSARLERSVGSLADLYNLLETRLREAELAEAVQAPDVRIVDAASLPFEPSFPRAKLNLALALVLGLGLGLTLAFVREHADRRIHGRRALERYTDLPVLSQIPALREAAPLLPVTPAREPAPVPALPSSRSTEPSVTAEGNGAPPIWPFRRRAPRATDLEVAIESFRSLGTDLGFVAHALKDGDFRSLAITSPGRGDGKTFISCNLALTRARSGIDTLLVDADMRASGVSQFLGLSRSPGLSQLLSGEITSQEARRRLRAGESDALTVVTAGDPRPDAAELLRSRYFEALLAAFQATHELVIVDTPPLNILTDAAGVVSAVDGVLVVVRQGVTEGTALELTLERLERIGAPLLGVVMNGADLPAQYTYGTYSYA